MESGNRRLNWEKKHSGDKKKMIIAAAIASVAVIAVVVTIILVKPKSKKIMEEDERNKWNEQFSSSTERDTHDVLVVKDADKELRVEYSAEERALVVYEDGERIQADVSLGVEDSGVALVLDMDKVNMALVQNVDELETHITGAYVTELATSYGVLKWHLQNGYIMARKVERHTCIEVYVQNEETEKYKRLIITDDRLLIADYKLDELPDIWGYLLKDEQ